MRERRKFSAVFFSFVLIAALMTALLVLMHTNHRLESIQWQMLYTASDCCVEGIGEKDVELLEEEIPLEWYALQQAQYEEYSINSSDVFVYRGDGEYITMTCRLEKGRMPSEEYEVAAERWVLLNMGIEPECGKKFTLHSNAGGKEVSYILSGILSDISSNKTYGIKCLYAPLGKNTDDRTQYHAYLRFPHYMEYEEGKDSVCHLLGIKEKKVKKCPGREDFDELLVMDGYLMGAILVIAAVIFYGVYRIGLAAKQKEYGIFRAVGMTQWQLRCRILYELYRDFLPGVPAGAAGGVLAAFLVSQLSGDMDQEIYLNNSRVLFQLVIPFREIMAGFLLLALLVSIVGLFSGWAVVRQQVPVMLSGEGSNNREGGGFQIREDDGRGMALFCLGSRYLFKDKKTSLFVILTVAVSTALFTGLFYQAEGAWIYRADTKEMYYLNGQYEMSVMHLDSMQDGISQEDDKEIQGLESVADVKSMAGFPVRVVDDKSVDRNNAYYEDMNKRFWQYMEYPLMGNDGKDDVYHSVFYGFNKSAMQKLKKYVVEGDIPEEGLKEDEIIVSVLSMDDTKENGFPGYYQAGTPLMDYHAGDRIQMKYRKDFNTASMEYRQMKDGGAEYASRIYKIAAIISFPYMNDCNRTLVPLLISSQEHLKKICPDYHIQRLYIDSSMDGAGKGMEELERKLIQIGNRSSGVSTRSMVDDIRKNNQIFQRQITYISSMAAVAFILVLINIQNNLKYRMQVRTREINMLRSIGMSVGMLRCMMVWENGILGTAGVLCGGLLTGPMLRFLYNQSERQAFAHPYQFHYTAFGTISALALLICLLLSIRLANSWTSRKIAQRFI